MNRLIPIVLSLWILTGCGLFRSTPVVSVDQEAERMIEQGKQLMRAERYADAMDVFAGAADRTWHRGTTLAIYMTGLAAHYANYDDVARSRFKDLIEDYPRSRYVDDAQYHLALGRMNNRSMRDQMGGALEMLTLIESTGNERLQQDGIKQLREFFFQAENLGATEFRNLYTTAEPPVNTYVMEAWLYRQARQGEWEQAQQQYETYLKEGGEKSDFLEKLFEQIAEEEVEVSFEPGILRLAISMPFFWDDQAAIYNQELPRRGVTSLEFYEGFRLAVEEYSDSTGKKVFLRMFDSKRDTTQVNASLQKMETYRPTLIVGDYYNQQSKVIAEWADTNRVPQIIPYSPSSELVEGRSYTFLAHPAVTTHGARMAEYAWYNQGLTRVAVFTDGSNSTEDLMAGFARTFLDLGGIIDTMRISANYEMAIDQIPDQVKKIVDDGTGVGVYIPLMGNEEAAGLIINLLRQRNKQLVIMGSPHFRTRYNTLSRDIKEYYQILFTTSHLHDPGQDTYMQLYREYLKRFNFPPSDNVIQGYDLGRYVLSVLSDYDPSMGVSLDNFFRIAKPFDGLHIDYRFDSQQSNQDVNIGQYTSEGIIRVN